MRKDKPARVSLRGGRTGDNVDRMKARRGCLLLLALAPALLQAQRAPRRPRLGADGDTNDAAAYFQLGLDKAERDPAQAEAAFYWASHLDPLSPQALYALSVARLLKE